MYMFKSILNLTAAAVLTAVACSSSGPENLASSLQRDVTGGTVEGVRENGILVFKGIPYAAPPTGDFRWREPQPVIPWEGVRKCDKFGPISMQDQQVKGSFYEVEFYSEGLPEMSEDCLYLNVYAPENAEGLPVAMWIHGGGFGAGYGYEVTMDGAEWAKNGVILVTINYRLGILGFLSHPLLSAEQGGTSGNYGLLDQIAALQWIHDNIASFGGDPDNVTIFGQSAGGMSVRDLVTSPAAKPLISKAIIQSAGGFECGAANLLSDLPAVMVEGNGKEIFDALGYDTLEKMRAVPATQLRSELSDLAKTGKNLITFPHTGAGAFPKSFDNALKDGSIADIPYLIGSVEMDGDMLGGPGIDTFAKMRSEKGGQPVYEYLFKRHLPGEDNPGAFHSSELWYIFGTLGKSWRPFTEKDYELSQRMLKAWISFIKTGNPGWDASTAGNLHTEVFDIAE